VRELVHFRKADALPERHAVLESQDLPDEDALAPRLSHLLEQAMAEYVALVEPVAVVEETTAAEFASVLAPLELAEDALVVGRVYRQAAGLALYVATLGPTVPARIRQLFDQDALAEGYMLDSVASVGADLLSERLATRFEERLRESGMVGVRALAYSPGYCGWPTQGQRALFAALRPEEIGVSLSESCLMAPIKSVSGVLLAGEPQSHRFRPDFPFCDVCRSRECGRRMASVLKG
jgi:hypothetical protein